MNILEKFLKFTEYTVPHGFEYTLEYLLPKGVKKDKIGNYYITIGNSESLFVSHLDTYSKKRQKVNHVIEGNIIKTDGKTILGSDNKCGVVVLCNMIEHNVPGTYFFFVGEEPPYSMLGSRTALEQYPMFFKNFKRVIAFDRKKDCSIITRQYAINCCSNEFVEALIKDLRQYDIHFSPDPTGWYTDSAAFIEVIPEVTNLSVGVWNEHTENEYVDIKFLEKIAHAATMVKWEDLPTVRNITIYDKINIKKFNPFTDIKSKKTLKKLMNFFEILMFRCLNCNNFTPGEELIFSHWHQDIEITLIINNGVIYDNDTIIGDIYDLIEYLDIDMLEYVDHDDILNNLYDIIDDYMNIDDKKIISILDKNYLTIEQLKELMNKNKKFNNVLYLKNNKIYLR